MQKKGHGPDGGYGWVVVIAATVANLINDGILLSFGIILVELTEVFNKSIVSVAAIPAIQVAVTGLVSPCAGSLVDKFGKRQVVITGSVLCSGGLLLSSFAKDIEVFYITYGVLGGLGIGLMYGPVAASVVEHFTEKRTLASGIAFSGSGIGIFAMNPILSVLLAKYGWRGIFMILAGVQLNCVACGLALLPPLHASDERYTEPSVSDERYPEPSVTIHSSNLWRKFGHFFIMISRLLVLDSLALLTNFHGAIFIISVFFYGLSIGIPYSFIAKQAVELGMSKMDASWISSSLGISNTVSRIIIGWIGDRTCVSRTVMLKCILLLTGIVLPSSLAVTSFEGKMVSTCIIGTLLGGYIAIFPAILADLFKVANIGKSIGLFMLVLSVAAVVGMVVAGWTVDVTGNFDACFVWGGAGCILSCLILLLPIAKDLCQGLPIRNRSTHL